MSAAGPGGDRSRLPAKLLAAVAAGSAFRSPPAGGPRSAARRTPEGNGSGRAGPAGRWAAAGNGACGHAGLPPLRVRRAGVESVGSSPSPPFLTAFPLPGFLQGFTWVIEPVAGLAAGERIRLGEDRNPLCKLSSVRPRSSAF